MSMFLKRRTAAPGAGELHFLNCRHTSPFHAAALFRKRDRQRRQNSDASLAMRAGKAHARHMCRRERDDRENEDYCRLRRNRPRVIFPGIGQELAPERLPPGCCGFFGPVPSATRDKACSTCRQPAQYASTRGRVKRKVSEVLPEQHQHDRRAGEEKAEVGVLFECRAGFGDFQERRGRCRARPGRSFPARRPATRAWWRRRTPG